MTAVEKLLQVAKNEVGYLEKDSKKDLDSKTANAGDANITKYARDLDKLGAYHASKQGLSWCDMFCDWCFVTAFGLEKAFEITCQPIGKYGAGCTESANYYKKAGRFYENNPKPGDQIFFTSNGGRSMYHTGLVKSVSGGKVYTIEGNTSSAPGVVENGGAVAEKSYLLTNKKIGGYGRPNYSLVEEDDDMDVKRFEELWKEYRKTLQDNDAAAWSESARKWAVDTGLVAGGSTNEPNYMWEDVLTREQATMLFYRFAQMMGKV